MSSCVGVLVDRRTLLRALRNRSTYERIAFYRSIATEELGIDIIVFSVDGIRERRNKVTGYVPTSNGWRKTTTTIPKVIHKRVLYRQSAPLKTLRRLQRRRGTLFVNPLRIQNKADMNKALTGDPAVAAHIPPTQALRWRPLIQALEAGTSIIIKPRIGSVGQGILRIEPTSGGRFKVTSRTTRVHTRAGLRKRLRARLGSGRYIMQHYLMLARVDDKPFDLRVPVQRDGSGAWRLPGMVAKVAGPHPFLTNLAKGGRAIPGRQALESAFAPADAGRVVKSVNRLALNVAKAVAQSHPRAADLGLDIGVDQEGKAWLIEVNTRDQRITFFEAGLHDEFRTLYKNPLAYCAHLAGDAPTD